MGFGIVVAAVVTAVMVTGLCFAADWRKLHIVAPLQFIAALGVTSWVGPLRVPDAYASDAFLVALLISAAMPVGFVILRVMAGLFDKPDEDKLSHAGDPVSQRLNW